MVDKIRRYIEFNQLFEPNDPLLLAVSGGVDSMVLLHLLKQLGYNFAVAHMNFGLRGNDSKLDELFVIDTCEGLNIKYHIKEVDTQMYMVEHKCSVQVAARELRYKWFNELKSEFSYKYLLTAHHSDDSVETIIMNIVRGTGISGLHGIRNTDTAKRPLLCVSRNEIQDYANINDVKWREDSSNAKDIYLRNKLRNVILPEIDKVNDAWRLNLLNLSDDIHEAEQILKDLYTVEISKYYDGNKILIDEILKDKNASWLIRTLFIELGFTHANISDILQNLKIQKGKYYESPIVKLISNGSIYDIIRKSTEIATTSNYFVDDKEIKLFVPGIQLNFGILSVSKDLDRTEKNSMFLDFNKLKFPLEIRNWRAGDWFVPLGMKGKKKLSDFFVDEKFTIQQKENTFVMVSGEDIVCILGYRIDDRFKLTDATSKIYKINLING